MFPYKNEYASNQIYADESVPMVSTCVVASMMPTVHCGSAQNTAPWQACDHCILQTTQYSDLCILTTVYWSSRTDHVLYWPLIDLY
jgi:hypothetical protein